MKLLIILSLTLATALSFDLHGAEIQPVVKNEGGHQFPHHVNLLIYTKYSENKYCGGSLIGNNWVLTTGYCTHRANYASVYLGATDSNEAEIVFHVPENAIITHTGYNGSPLYNIGLIEIPWVEFNSSIQPVKLPSLDGPYSTYSGEYAIVSHLEGNYEEEKFFTTEVHSTRLQVIGNDACENTYNFHTSSNMCGSTADVESTCLSGYGDPLTLESTGVLIGLTSSVPLGGCPMSSPGTFQRVTSYLYWIFQKTGIFY